jgi:16S rRNA (adenine1518-N6/adenine1519-N6)-dimethyltransferase
MEILESPAVSVMREDFFFRVVRASFMHRRKTLANALAHELKIPKENVSAAIKILGLTQAARGETLSLEKFARLSDVLLGVFDN